MEFGNEAALAPAQADGEYTVARHTPVPAPTRPEQHAGSTYQDTQNAMAVAAMNGEMDRWTQAAAPDMFEKGMEGTR